MTPVDADDDERAIGYLERALGQLDPRASTDVWVAVHRQLAELHDRGIRRSRPADLQKAIAHLEAALQAATRPQDEPERASLRLALARAYATWTLGNVAENLETSLGHAQAAAAHYTPERSPFEWTAAQMALANIHFRRVRGEKATNLELAISYAERVLATEQADLAEERAIAHGNLGNYYVHRVAGVHGDNLHRALGHYEEAGRYFTRERYPDEWARQQLNVAHLFLKQPNGIGFDDIETAIHHLQLALEVRTYDRDPVAWATTKLNLASAYGRRARGNRRANVAEVERHIDEALLVFTRDRYPGRWAEAHTIAAEVALVGWRDTSTPEAGSMMVSVSFAELDAEDVARGVGHLREALLEKSRDRSPGVFRDIQLGIARVYFARGDSAEAHAAYAPGIDVGIELFTSAHSVVGREAELTAILSAYANDAYCLFELGDYGGSFLQMERGKARQLVEALRLSDVALDRVDAPSRDALRRSRAQVRELEEMARTSAAANDNARALEVAEQLRVVRAEIRTLLDQLRGRYPELFPVDPDLSSMLAAIPPGGAIVAPLVTSAGAIAFVLPAGARSVTAENVVVLPALGAGTLDTLLRGPRRARIVSSPNARPPKGWLADRTGDGWKMLVDETTTTLWDALVGTIVERLHALGIAADGRVIFLPHGGLGLLPLHAARRGDALGGRYLLDDFSVSYAPGAHAFAARARVPDTATPTLLAAVNPTGDLAFAELEGHWIAALFADDRRSSFTGPQATTGALIAAAPGCGYVHFGCHGVFRWDAVAESGLLMAGDSLTLARVVRELDLRSARLVTLSACETGQTESSQWPDEFVGLPAAFIQAGARAVLSTLWAVEDVSSALLMAKFYEVHIAGAEPSAALRTAQRWLRDVTAANLATRFREERRRVGESDSAAASELASVAWRRFLAMNPTDRPFAHPFYWAAFTLYEA